MSLTGKLQVLIEPDPDGGYQASCFGIKGCHAYGDSYTEALTDILDRIQSAVELLVRESGIELDLQLPAIVWAARGRE